MSVLFRQPVRPRFFLQALTITIFLFASVFAQAAQVTLQWDPNDPAPDGYRVFLHREGEAYDYTSPVWPGPGDDALLTACDIGGLADDTQYYFVVRAYVGDNLSGNSNEVSYRTEAPTPSNFTLTATSGANGSISPGTATVTAGGSQTFTIAPNLHYHVVDVVVDGQSVGPVSSYTFSDVNADHTISASFSVDVSPSPQTFQVTLAWDPNEPTPDGYRVFQRKEGEVYDYTSPVCPHAGGNPLLTDCGIDNLAADTQYYFVVRAYVGNIESGDSDEVSFRTDSTVASSYTISASAGPYGAIFPGTSTVSAGDSKTFTITPYSHYHVNNVMVDGQPIGPVTSYTFSQVNADHSISTSFAIDAYTIAASAGAHGSIAPAGTADVSYGSSKTYSISPTMGYHVADVLVDGNSVGAVSTYTLTQVAANHTISASFAIDTFTITASASAHGSISPAGTATVNYGSSKAYSISPAAGYHVADVMVDGHSVGAVSSYTFSQVNANHNISVSFAIDTFTISSSAGTGGTISPSGPISVDGGANQSFNLAADEGYEIEELIVDGVSMSSQSSYTFYNVTTDHNISATFVPTNQSPVADAGPDQVVDEAQLVTLSGINSQDPDDGIARFQWRQIQGDPVTLSAPEEEITTFTAPDVNMAGKSFVFELTVTDTAGLTAKDTCIVNVTWVNEVPTARAGVDQTVSEGGLVTLNATASTDPDDGISAYTWHQVQGPEVNLFDPSSASSSFTAPDVGPQGASLVFELTVTDAGGLQDTDTCTVNVTWNNLEPTADAGPDQRVEAGGEVTLDGSQSVDPDGTSLLYQWRQTDGPPVNLSDATAMRPVFTVPLEGFDDALLVFQLTVTDNGGLQGVDTCEVAVQAVSPPQPDEDADTLAPILTVEDPGQDYIRVSSSRINISGTALDDRGVNRVVWVNDRGQSGSAYGTENWRIYRLRLHRGTNTCTITAYDAAGNSQSKTLTIYYGRFLW